MIYFVNGHLDLTQEEFDLHYKPKIDKVLEKDCSFVIGDAEGADTLAQKYLKGRTDKVIVYHMFTTPRNNIGFKTKNVLLLIVLEISK